MTTPAHSQSAQPWWAEVAHLRTEEPAPTRSTAKELRRERLTAEHRVARPAAPAARRRAARPESRPAAPQRQGRPRATLVDVAPGHALVTPRAPMTRRRPGERPTVTITGRPEAALPPRPAASATHVPAARARERVSSFVASPDRMIMWAVALGILMIIASIGTATAGAT